MSTQKNNSPGWRIAQLLATDEKIFHLKDLAVLWNIDNYNTLRTTIKRYCGRGLIYRIYKGFYSAIPKEKINPVLLGIKAIHGYAYLSTESILFREGYISRKIAYFTFVAEKSQKFSIGENQFMSRQLTPDYLFNTSGLIVKDGILQADIYRAIADMLYFNPKFHFDREIEWKEVKKIQKEIGYPLTKNRYVNSRSSRR